MATMAPVYATPTPTAASWRARWAARPRRVPTVLAPALPALILLAITTAGTVDPPRAGLDAQLRLTGSVTTSVTGHVSYPVTAR